MDLRIRSLRPLVYRAPVDTPVVTSFGIMRDRPMVLVRVEDDDGVVGWGEIWCNYPAVGAEHRARLVASVLAPIVEGKTFDSPRDAFDQMTAMTAVLAIQSGEPGPIAQAIAGVDIACWDLAARKAGTPLWHYLGGAESRVRVYASGLNPDQPDALALARFEDGHRAFKLKIGFGAERDLENLRLLRVALGDDIELMADANQAWSLESALETAPQFEAFNLRWLEEPLRADCPWSLWRRLAAVVSTPLAAGENIAGAWAFDAALVQGVLGVVQPDCAKWGGLSGCLPVAQRVLDAGRRFCPHWLGGGVGLLASAHLLAAVGGDGRLEVDANTNPLRTALSGPVANVSEGECNLGIAPGLGIDPAKELEQLERYRVVI